jgi:hypothetical protein
MMLKGRAGRVIQVLTTPKWIIAGGSNGTILLWDLPHCILIKKACDEAQIEPQAAEGAAAVITT